jgi:NAD-dependent SIR2 family protein deacetylase
MSGLCARAGHPPRQLANLHGSLFDLKCSDEDCGYVERDNWTDPIVPALAIPREHAPEPASTRDGTAATSNLLGALSGSLAGKELDIANAEVALPRVEPQDLPSCPQCKKSLLRPGVVWFGEPLPEDTLEAIDRWIGAGKIDLMLVIGTSAQVYPAAGYVSIAQSRGARVAVVNMDGADQGGMNLGDRDWFFQGDAGELLPRLFYPVIGNLPADGGPQG